jgi:hypothetical protein
LNNEWNAANRPGVKRIGAETKVGENAQLELLNEKSP